jgi:hypothetical protein
MKMLIMIMCCLVFSGSAVGAIRVWNGGGGNLNLSTPGNWVGDIAPVANDDLSFPDGSLAPVINNDYNNSMVFRSIAINGDSYIFNGNNLNITGGFSVNLGVHIINCPLILSGSEQSFYVLDLGARVTVAELDIGTTNIRFDGDEGTAIINNLRGSGQITNTEGSNLVINGSNGFTGNEIYIENGKVEINANIPNTEIPILAGTLSGRGSVGDVNDGFGNVFPSNAPLVPSILSTKNFFLSNFSGFVFTYNNVGGATPLFSRVNVTGSVTVTGAFFLSNFTSQNIPVFNVPSIIIENDGIDPIIGTFFGLPEGTIFDLFDVQFRISYIGGTGNDVTLTALSSVNPDSEGDFDGDGKSDFAIFRPTAGEWYFMRSGNGAVNGAQFGSANDKPVSADFTGDRKTDFSFFRPSSGEWFVLRSEDSSFFAFPFGTPEDIPTPSDFDGDGKADQAVFRPSNGVWYINKSTGGVTIQPFGTNGDRPVVADYDGDRKSDISIFRPSVGEWYYLRSTDSQIRGAQFGSSTDRTVQGDYTGDGKADFAFFRPSSGQWFVLRSENSSFFASPFGISTDIPTIGDYDGDGKFDQAVFRPSDGVWYVNKSNGSGVTIQQFGASMDVPVPSYYLP